MLTITQRVGATSLTPPPMVFSPAKESLTPTMKAYFLTIPTGMLTIPQKVGATYLTPHNGLQY